MDRAVPGDGGPVTGVAPRGAAAFATRLTGRIPDLAAVGLGAWFGILVVSVVAVGFVSAAVWGTGMGFPVAWSHPIAFRVDAFVDWLTTNMDWLFDGFSNAILQLLVWIEDFLLWVPWPATMLAVFLLSWRASVSRSRPSRPSHSSASGSWAAFPTTRTRSGKPP